MLDKKEIKKLETLDQNAVDSIEPLLDEPCMDPIEKLTAERGSKYGAPIDHFSCVTRMEREWVMRRSESPHKLVRDKEDALRHGVHMILDKLVRAAESPEHIDNWDDVQGYAKCIKGLF